MCRAESQRLRNSNLTSLLINERFHRCMLAFSAELVLATHKTVTMMFPAVLERAGITAFDLGKVIESFVRHEETLPRELGLLAEPMPSLDTIAMHHNLTSGSLQLSSIPHKIEATSDNNTAAPTSPQRHAAPAVVSSSSTEIVVVRALVLVLFDASFPEWPLRDTSTSDVLDDVKR
ncbi:hypothetical protein KI387_034542, partial [Taxus chinensis]